MFPTPATSRLDKRFEVSVLPSGAPVVQLAGEVAPPPPVSVSERKEGSAEAAIEAAVAEALSRIKVSGGGSGSGGGGAAGGGGGKGKKSSGTASWALEGIGSRAKPSTLPLEERVRLSMSVAEECVDEAELRKLLEKKPSIRVYDGFEPSGRMHLAQALCKGMYIDRLTKSGMTFILFLADYHAALNNKMGGDLAKIRTVGEYMIEVWRACGVDVDGGNVEVVFAADVISKDPDGYWGRVMDVARRNSLSRILRCTQIMGRSESDALSAAQILYPCMQAADIFFLGADVCQLGMDQRKVNMLAREYCDAARPKIPFKPVILSHHMMMGLKEGMEKMSKSIPDSAIFMEDSAADVARKIRGAYCPERVIENNPCTELVQYVVLPKFGEISVVLDSTGEPAVFREYEPFRAAYVTGDIHPGNLKVALTEAINAAIEPVRKHFATDPRAKELLAKVKSYKTTR